MQLKGVLVLLTAIGAFFMASPLIRTLTILYLLIEDIMVYFAGGKSGLGLLIEGLKSLGQMINEMPIVNSIKNIGEAVNKYFTGGGFANLKNLFSFFTNFGLGGFGALGQQIMQTGLSNLQNNNQINNNTTNNTGGNTINIRTDKVSEILPTIENIVTGQNLMGTYA